MSVPAVGVLAQQVDQDEPTFQELMQGRAPHPLKQRSVSHAMPLVRILVSGL